MRVWIINHYAIPPSMGGLVRHYYFSKFLRERGHQVRIFTASEIHNTDINMIRDGALYRGRDVVVAGGGNTAAEDALYLSRFARRVVIVHRRDAFRAARALVDRMEKTANIDIVYDHVVESIAGGQKLEEVALRNVKTGSVRALAADGLFVAVGMEPKTELVHGQVELADGGYIRAGEDTRTSLPLVYAAGDIRTKPLRQVVCAAADGAVAASMAALDLGA